MGRHRVRRLFLTAAIFATVLAVGPLAAAGAQTVAGVCLPAGVHLPSGAPSLPPCPKPVKGARLRVEVSGGVTVTVSGHQGDPTDHATTCLGWSTFSGTTEMNFGQTEKLIATAAIDKHKQLTRLGPVEPAVRMTFNPKAQAQHGSPPGCTAQTDTVTCSQTVANSSVTVSGRFQSPQQAAESIIVTMTPTASFHPGCPAPFENGVALGQLTFTHELDEVEIGSTPLLLGPKPAKGAKRTATFAWTAETQPCSAYGVQAGGLDTCTIMADFKVVLTRMS